MKKLKYIFFAIPLIFSCRKLIEVNTPQNQLTTDKVFADTSSATAALVNIYAMLDKNLDPNSNKYIGVYTDELNYSSASPDITQYASSRLSSTNAINSTFWGGCYSAIYGCNQGIEQLLKSDKLPAAYVTSALGEAKFLRAYCYLFLISYYGSVPLILTTDVDHTSKAARSDSTNVYNQIISDLNAAQTVLPNDYISTDRTRANKWAAIALLARANLYSRKWADAEQQASSVITSGIYSLDPLTNVFLANSTETILSVWTQNGYITDATSLIPSSGIPQFPVNPNLINAFEAGDQRLSFWVKPTTVTSSGSVNTYYFPYKYHNRTVNISTPEYLVLLRLGEQYLIRAEARAQQSNISGAIQDLNVIRRRAGLTDLLNLTQSQCLQAIAHEWRIEFCFEDGLRFINLKRTGQINSVMTALKPGWTINSMLLPIPKNDLTSDPYLTQNPGY